jgi:hypothetical protein
LQTVKLQLRIAERQFPRDALQLQRPELQLQTPELQLQTPELQLQPPELQLPAGELQSQSDELQLQTAELHLPSPRPLCLRGESTVNRERKRCHTVIQLTLTLPNGNYVACGRLTNDGAEKVRSR